MGRVWRARDETLHRDVAVKQIVLPPELLDSARDVAMERTLREARAAARLSHPNVVRVYDVLAAEGQPWLVMEYVRSRSLDQVIREDGPLPPRRVAEIGLAVLDALRAAQRVGVDHRDIKPGNVLLAEDGRVVLTDFGIARVEGEGHVTRTGLVLGSPEFIAPERAREGIAGPASDLWSLGATLYTAVEGRSPFGRGSAMETLSALASEEADPPQRAGPLVPVLRALLRKDPKARADFVQTDELLRRALLRPEQAKKKRSWLSGWGRTETAAPAVPAQRSPTTRPERPARPVSPAASPLTSGSPDTPASSGDTPPSTATPSTATPSTSGAVGGPAAGTMYHSGGFARGKAVVPPPAGPVEEADTAKSGVIEGPIFGAAAEDEVEPDLEEAAESATVRPGAETEQASATWTPRETETRAEIEPEPVAEVASEHVAEAEPEPEPTVAETEAEPVAEIEPEPEPETAAMAAEGEAATQAQPAVGAETRIEQRPAVLTAERPTRAAGAAAVVAAPGRTRTEAEKRRRGILVGGGAAVLVAVILVWVAVSTDGDDTKSQGTGNTETTAAGAAPAPTTAATSGSGSTSGAPAVNQASPTAETPKAGNYSGTMPPLPPGWIDYHDPTGFSVYMPQGWTKSFDGPRVYFRGGGRTLGIDQTNEPKMDPVADWTKQEADRGGSYYKNYQGLGIRKVDNYFVVAADWEFIYGTNGRQHVNNRGVVTSDHQAYGIWWSTSESDWSSARADLDIMFASFRPKP